MQPPSQTPKQTQAPEASFEVSSVRNTENFDELIARSGIRNTQQRRYVYEALMEQRDHPTAQDIFMRVKAKVPAISLATVYNCLETLTGSGLIRHVNLDRAPSRYCQNPAPHGHFFCDECGSVADVPLKTTFSETWEVPPNATVSHAEVTLRGLCADCSGKPTSAISDTSTLPL